MNYSRLIIVALLFVIIFLTMVKEPFNETIYFKDNVKLKQNATVRNLNVIDTLKTKEFQIGDIRVNEDQLDALRSLPVVFKNKICLSNENICLDKETIEFMRRLNTKINEAENVFLKVKI